MNNLQFLDDTNLSSSTESTNGIPFANENIGTIKQRSPQNHYNTLTVQPSLDTMKRSLPNEFLQPSIITPIYDNHERLFPKNTPLLNKQLRKTSLPREEISSNVDKRLNYIEVFKKDKQNKLVK